MDNASGAPRRENWGDYYRVTSGRPPRELLRQTLLRFPRSDGSPRLAIDLGCGAGIETMALLEQGWHVLAIDQQQEATAGEDGYVDDDESDTHPAKPTTTMRPFSLPLRAAPKSTVRPESRQTVTY